MGRMPAMPQSLLDVVAGEFLTEGGGGAVLVLGLVEHGNSGVQRSADDEVLLPGDLVGGVCLRLGAGAEADARDAVTALDGNAVGGEGPLVGQGTAPAGGHGLLVSADALGTPQGVVGVDQGLDVGSGLLVIPDFRL